MSTHTPELPIKPVIVRYTLRCWTGNHRNSDAGMRIALWSDIHGNIVGLRAILKRLDQLGSADVLYALGDFLAIGPGTEDVIDLLIARQVQMVRGNWDEIFIDPNSYIARAAPNVRATIVRHFTWLQRNLSSQAQALLAGLPLHAELALAPQQRLLVCHAAPHDPWSDTRRADTPTTRLRDVYGRLDAEIVAYGHYHAHHVIPLDSKLLINVASVGMSRGNAGASAFTLLEYADDRWTVQQYQVPFDVNEFEHLCRERGVPQD